MVVFVDLDSEDDDSSSALFQHHRLSSSGLKDPLEQWRKNQNGLGNKTGIAISLNESTRSLENRGSFAAALACYPVALSISSQLDLNDLHSLSLTCRSLHTSLSQFSHQLIAYSLRCINDAQPSVADILAIQAALDLSGFEEEDTNSADQRHTSGGVLSHTQIAAAIRQWPQIPDGMNDQIALGNKIGACALDLVAPCRKCGTVVCRNCAAKAPSDRFLKDRYRRLCRACLEAPISAHLKPLTESQDLNDSPPVSSASSARSHRSVSNSSETSSLTVEADPNLTVNTSFTSSAFLRDPCDCASRGVFLCSTCGHNLRAADITYKRVWTWRSRYSTHIGGGLGTGLGEGNQGQKCGRGDQCLERGTAGVCWVEIDCSEGVNPDQERDLISQSRTGTPVNDHHSPDHNNNKPGYFRQEIEGIGGVVKKKVKKRVKVGATVWEYDDERESGKYLEREASGQARSWCGWCSRICLGEKDRDLLKNQ